MSIIDTGVNIDHVNSLMFSNYEGGRKNYSSKQRKDEKENGTKLDRSAMEL